MIVLREPQDVSEIVTIGGVVFLAIEPDWMMFPGSICNCFPMDEKHCPLMKLIRLKERRDAFLNQHIDALIRMV